MSTWYSQSDPTSLGVCYVLCVVIVLCTRLGEFRGQNFPTFLPLDDFGFGLVATRIELQRMSVAGVGGWTERLMARVVTICMNCHVSGLCILEKFVMYLRLMYYWELWDFMLYCHDICGCVKCDCVP